MKMKFETLIIAFFFNIFLILSYLNYINQIYGVDAWYWLRVSNMKPQQFNLLAMLFFSSIYFLFKDKKLFFFFIINSATIKFLEVELDDYLYFLFSFILIANANKKLMLPIALSIYIFYSITHINFYHEIFNNTFSEMSYDLKQLLTILPTFYILLRNKKIKYFLLIFLLAIIFPTGKIISSALIIVIFSIFKLFEKEKIKLKYEMAILLLFLIAYISSSWEATLFFVKKNLEGFYRLCDIYTKICFNYDVKDWWLGHYFDWLGFQAEKHPY